MEQPCGAGLRARSIRSRFGRNAAGEIRFVAGGQSGSDVTYTGGDGSDVVLSNYAGPSGGAVYVVR
jgi:hypothetical protein